MGTLGAIDIGSNAIRIMIGEVDPNGEIRVVKKSREPVRLGKDVFATGEISTKTQEKAIEAFCQFNELLKAHDVRHVKAVATSALREAKNREAFVEKVRLASGIRIDVIDGIEEGRLIYSAVAHRVDLRDRVSLLIDIGGGSVELTIADHGTPIASQSFPLGTVRLLQLLETKGLKEKNFAQLIHDQLKPARDFLAMSLRGIHLDMVIGTGGNMECFGKLRVALLHKSSIFSISIGDLDAMIHHLLSISIKDRIEILRLRPDRADVVIPAALVTAAILKTTPVERLTIPYVGLRDGILADLATRVALAAQQK